jgi:uncharacterized protein with PQ loop repeat
MNIKNIKNYWKNLDKNKYSSYFFIIYYKEILYTCYFKMEKDELKVLPYTATSLSVVGRFIFMYLIYKNKSVNTLSLIFCILSIFSSSMWIYYSTVVDDLPMIIRSSTELTLITLSSMYIIRNKVIEYKNRNKLPN